MIRSVLHYVSPTWTSCDKENLGHVFKLQKRAARAISGYSFMLCLRQIDLMFHIIVIDCPHSVYPVDAVYLVYPCIPCILMYTLYTLYTLYTHVYPVYLVYPVYPVYLCIPMYTLYTLYTYVYLCIPCKACTSPPPLGIKFCPAFVILLAWRWGICQKTSAQGFLLEFRLRLFLFNISLKKYGYLDYFN